jgi:nucleotide-binding universal stress UspA family protein
MTVVKAISSSAVSTSPQMAPERVLISVDFRRPSLAAARWAAAHFGTCAIELAHVLPIPEVPAFLRPVMPALDDRLQTAAPSLLPALRGFAGTLGAKDLSVQVRVGPPVESLAEAAAAFGAELVVLAREALDGSWGRTLERLIRRLPVPALVVDSRVRESPRRILAAVDDAAVGSNVVGWAAALAQYFGAELMLLHALNESLLAHQWPWEERACESDSVRLGKTSRLVAPTHAWLQRLSDDVGRAPRGRTIVAVGAPGPVILGRARVSRADLIVVGRNGSHAMSSADIGSTTRLTLRAAQVPVLVVPSTNTSEVRHGQTAAARDLGLDAVRGLGWQSGAEVASDPHNRRSTDSWAGQEGSIRSARRSVHVDRGSDTAVGRSEEWDGER